MPRKQDKQSNDKQSAGVELYVPKYLHPKILLVDMENAATDILKSEGYNVSTGSFGVPYKVPRSDKLVPVIAKASLPDYTEQEIIVIDLVPGSPADQPTGEKHTTPREKDWWASCNRGVINPRPRVMIRVREDFDRILSHGGVFIIFADERDLPTQALGHLEHEILIREENIPFDNWCFLSQLDSNHLEVKPDQGKEMTVMEGGSSLGACLSQHTTGANFVCTLHPLWIKESWITLATNKYGAPVAGVIVENKKKRGLVFIFPRLRDRPRFLSKFLKDVLPDLSPHLFPEMEGARWVQRPEYELPSVLEKQSRIKQIEEAARIQVLALEKEAEEERNKLGYLHALIRDTGHSLVDAVRRTLELLGFHSVVDVDEEMKETGDTGPRREDLQIHDKSPIVLVEVKGISSLPRDTEVLQVWKYLAPRMKEWGRTDVHGLSIINHQRNLPAMERENTVIFREDLLTNAREQGFGLLTTWDLFRLARSYLKNGWKHEQVQELFCQNGRIELVPSHYQFVGVVEHFWDRAGAVGVRIQTLALRQGDRVAFELPVEFEEQDVESLQVENQPVAQAEIGVLAGIKTKLTKDQAKKGVRIFRLVELPANQ